MEEVIPPTNYTDVRLQVPQIKKRAQGDEPYFKIWVKTDYQESEQLVYIDTSEQQMLYGPLTYDGTVASNLSVVTKLIHETADLYTISSIVLPDSSLTIMGAIAEVPYPIYSTVYTAGSSVKFHLEGHEEDDQNFALYTDIDNDPKQKAYLLPQKDPDVLNGPRQWVIRAVETPEDKAKDNYIFSASISENPCAACRNKSRAVSNSSSFENWCNII